MSKAITYIDQLADSLSKFPGIGRKGAERIAYFIVKSNKSFSNNLIESLKDSELQIPLGLKRLV